MHSVETILNFKHGLVNRLWQPNKLLVDWSHPLQINWLKCKGKGFFLPQTIDVKLRKVDSKIYCNLKMKYYILASFTDAVWMQLINQLNFSKSLKGNIWWKVKIVLTSP